MFTMIQESAAAQFRNRFLTELESGCELKSSFFKIIDDLLEAVDEFFENDPQMLTKVLRISCHDFLPFTCKSLLHFHSCIDQTNLI